MNEIDYSIDQDCLNLRYMLRLLAEEGTLPKRQVVDIILDFRQEQVGNEAVADWVLYRVNPQIQSTQVYLSWDDIDSALSELEEP